MKNKKVEEATNAEEDFFEDLSLEFESEEFLKNLELVDEQKKEINKENTASLIFGARHYLMDKLSKEYSFCRNLSKEELIAKQAYSEVLVERLRDLEVFRQKIYCENKRNENKKPSNTLVFFTSLHNKLLKNVNGYWLLGVALLIIFMMPENLSRNVNVLENTVKAEHSAAYKNMSNNPTLSALDDIILKQSVK